MMMPMPAHDPANPARRAFTIVELIVAIGLLSILILLASRLRTEIRDGTPSEPTVAAVEWALDRHHRRAVEVMSDVLQEESDVVERARELLDEPGQDVSGELQERLRRVFRAILPRAVR